MKKLVLAFVTALALTLMVGCASGSPAASSSDASASKDSATNASGGIVVDKQAKTVTLPAVATGNTDKSSIHFLVNKDGGNAGVAYFTSAVTSRELFNALEEIGGTHGDNIKVEDKSGTIEGSDLKMTVEFNGKSFSPSDLVAGAQDRSCKPRFGGNIDLNEQYATGCLFCLESCSLGITSNAAYEYTEPEEFAPTANMPAAGTEVTITYAL